MTLREIDALVAEKVMGLEICYPYDDRAEPWYRAPDTQSGLRPVPAYSSDIAAAWQVLHKDHPCGWFDAFYLVRYGNGYAICQCLDDAVYVQADTAPMAISLAALKAHGVEVQL